jgi:cell division protease FtsH
VIPPSRSRRRRPARHLVRPALLALALLACLAPLAAASAAPAAQAPAGPPPPSLTQPLGGESPAAVVSYTQIVRAADGGRLNAAVVDMSAYWVAAIDRAGHVIGARIPRPQAGRDFATPGSPQGSPSHAQGSPRALPGAFDLVARLRADGVAVIPAAAATAAAGGGSGGLLGLVIFPLGMALLVALTVGALVFFRRRNGGAAGGRSRPGEHGRVRRNAQVAPPAVRFADVAGCDEAVGELQEIVAFLRDPQRFARVGARMPRGVILHGPPGTGKTLLARAVAGESEVPFFAMSGSDFVDTYVGVGASRVRDLFTQARQSKTGAIIFFDEFDAIGRARGGGAPGADSEREGTLNQLLVELDGFGARERLVVIGATNRLDMLDQAVLRPGRFDRRVQVGLPAETGRLAILRLHSRGMPIADPASLEGLARVTAGYAGADLGNIVNEAAIMAARAGREEILACDLDEGMLRAIAGPLRADRRLAEGELEVIAWHEAGHALAAELCPTHQKTQRVSILARGDTGGLALYGSVDRALTSQQHLHERMVVAMAGRAAEQVRFSAISSGAANDLEQVNAMARSAVERLGFSPRVGQIISAAGIQQMPLSETTRRTIDEEIGRMVDAAYADAIALLGEHRVELDALAEALLVREQLDRAELTRILGTITGGGRTRPAPAGALPTDRRPVAVRAVAPAPIPLRPEPAEFGGRRPGATRGRRIRVRAEAAAATLYALTFPRVGTVALRRRRRKRPTIA